MIAILRKCVCCGVEATDATSLEIFRKNKNLKHGRSNWCYTCYNNQYRGERKKGWDIKAKYNISITDYKEMLLKQNNRCAICGDFNDNIKYGLHIDHCHTTGKVRGLLCHHCNTAIGSLKENKNNFINAIKYLEERG